MVNRPKSRLVAADRYLTAGPTQRRMPLGRIFPMPHIVVGLIFCWLACLSGTVPSHAEPQPIPPLGVYVHVDLEEAIQQCTSGPMAQHNGKAPSKSDVQLCISGLYVSLLSPSYVSGMALGVHWDLIQLQSMGAFCEQYTCPSGHFCPPDIKCLPGTIIPIDVVVENPDFFDWSYIRDALGAARSAGKKVILKLTPGVESPQWLTDPATGQIKSCDAPVFKGGTADPNCGTQTFHHIPEQKRADSLTQPLPWNLIYQTAWANFLYQLKREIADQFPFDLVGIDIAGPNCASTEMILPTSAYKSYVNSDSSTGTTPADDAWAMLIKNTYEKSDPGLLNSDQAFVDSWYASIATYEAIFQNLTLIISPDDETSMPEIGPLSVHSDNFVYSTDGLCSASPSKFAVSCETKTEVLSNFLDFPTTDRPFPVPGGNLKGALVGGLIAASNPDNGKIGLPGVKLMVQKYRIFGGAEFDHPVSNPTYTQQEGCPLGQVCTCPKSNPNCTVETVSLDQAMLNVLGNFFNGTLYGGIPGLWGGTMGQQRLQYLLVEYEDIQYALNPQNQDAADFQYYLCDASIALYRMATRAPPACVSKGLEGITARPD